ncbi:MAG TPA: hypothetical protein VGI40_03925 [Pirellulaceae bacterium]|jgi:hypothetical protein
MNDAKLPVPPRPWRFQFSLKLLLVAFTAFAIGFPIWYRWPYEERDPDPTGTVAVSTTWQRQFGGGRVKHGLERLIASGRIVESTTYRNGFRHGPYENQGLHGQYENDLKEGVWTEPLRTTTWHRGKLDGPMEVKTSATRPSKRLQPAGSKPPPPEWRTLRLVFSEGRLTEFDGKPIANSRGKSAANRLFELQGTGTIDARTEAELGKFTTIDVVEMPVKDVALYLSETHNMHFVLDAKLGPSCDLPITCSYRSIDLGTVLLLLTAPNGLGCDYRYGCIWITTAEDGNDWHDPTGVSEIKPPKGGALALAWNEISPPVDCVQTPLTEILAYLKQPLAIDIDTSQIEKTTADSSPPLITLSLRGLRFCDTLGQLLYKTHCRCKLDGDKLVILPNSDTPPDP